ncbi:leucine-rich repeat extensin-like protein 5 [Helianthus annuus]|uniref:leucine-rich repeat extensin-like protein 5 n=1 Tax=Helianthus annuus TaxID=4232 RepID=UPI001653079F|nr:leucine-rich repeat extensin-like protein 5 [Helianthus annuus]
MNYRLISPIGAQNAVVSNNTLLISPIGNRISVTDLLKSETLTESPPHRTASSSSPSTTTAAASSSTSALTERCYIDGPPADAQGDGEIDEDVVAVPPPAVPVVEISSDSSLHSVSDSFESMNSSALRAAGSQLFATDSDDDTAMSAAPSPARDLTPPHDPEPGPEPAPIHFGQPDVAPIDREPILDPDHVPFGLPDTAPLIPDPVPAPVDLPLAEPFIPPPTPADVAPLRPVESDVHHTDFPITFLQDIPAPRPGEGMSGQPPSYDPFASAAFPPIPQTAPFAPSTSTPFDEPF